MASRRGIVNFIPRACTVASRQSIHHGRFISAPKAATALYACQPQRRWEGSQASSGQSKKYNFEEIKSLLSSPSPKRILIDTREPSELQSTGRIPGALNIPVGSAPDAWFLSEDAFEDKFGVAKPAKDVEIITYCKAGVRSRASAQLARQGGYEKTGEYPGSWLDWEKNGGDSEKV